MALITSCANVPHNAFNVAPIDWLLGRFNEWKHNNSDKFLLIVFFIFCVSSTPVNFSGSN